MLQLKEVPSIGTILSQILESKLSSQRIKLDGMEIISPLMLNNSKLLLWKNIKSNWREFTILYSLTMELN